MSVTSRGNATTTPALPAVIVFGEILWDIFAHSRRLGGAALNFAAHTRALGHRVTLVSAVGDDALGREARMRIGALDLDQAMIKTSSRLATGTAAVALSDDGEAAFSIPRPAAFDAIELSPADLSKLSDCDAGWLYFGSLAAADAGGLATLEALLKLPGKAKRFLDLNLRPGTDAPELVSFLLQSADVLKINADEFEQVNRITGLPGDIKNFCVQGRKRFGWQAVCVTLGARGCALLIGDEFVESPGKSTVVADTVGAGDAFAAGLTHGLSRSWPTTKVATFANHCGAQVAAMPGSLPDPPSRTANTEFAD